MNTPIVVLTGPMASGKSTLAKHLQQQKQAIYVNTREALEPTTPAQPRLSRKTLQDAGVQLDQKTNGRWVLTLLQKSIARNPNAQLFVIDSVRNPRQLAAIRSKHRDHLTVVHLHIPEQRPSQPLQGPGRERLIHQGGQTPLRKQGKRPPQGRRHRYRHRVQPSSTRLRHRRRPYPQHHQHLTTPQPPTRNPFVS